MKNYILNKIVFLALCCALSLTAFAQAGNSSNQNGASNNQSVVRVGFVPVKAGSVGEGMNAAELGQAIQNTLTDYLKSPKIELVPLESKLATALDAEAKEKQCAFVIYATVSHKKGGGGGFGMFKTLAPVLGNVIPMAGMAGGIAGSVATTVASTAINTAASASGSVKSKDEITLDIKINSASGANALTKQYKAKAKSSGEDIISPMIEQAAQNILDTVSK